MEMKHVTIKIISIEKDRIIGKNIGDDTIIEIEMNKNIYLGMLAEMKKTNICVDNDLKCFNNRIFTIVEEERIMKPKEMTKIFGISLRKDLE